MKYTLKKDRRFKIKQRSSGYCTIYKDDELIAQVINVEEARRVVWLELRKEDYIHEKDFEAQ